VTTAPVGLHQQASHPSAQILDSAAALARAELKLLWFHAQKLGTRVALAVGLTWIAMTLTQVALLVLALSPVIATSYGGAVLAASLAPVVLLAVIAWSLTLKRWLALTDRASSEKTPAATSLELSSGELGRR
jgi:hypothetical protein